MKKQCRIPNKRIRTMTPIKIIMLATLLGLYGFSWHLNQRIDKLEGKVEQDE